MVLSPNKRQMVFAAAMPVDGQEPADPIAYWTAALKLFFGL
jgi:hypothetical protein